MKFLLLVLPTLLLAGCSSIPDKAAGFTGVDDALAQHLDQKVVWRSNSQQDAEADEKVEALLARPLDADAAVQIALLNNRNLQAEYEELGVAQADLVQAGLLRNPVLSLSRLEGGGLTKRTLGIELDFLSLLLAAPQQRLQSLQFEHAKLRVAHAVLRHAAETRKAWVEAMAAQQKLKFVEQVDTLVQAEAELGERQYSAGNLSRRDNLRQQAFSAESALSLAQAKTSAQTTRENLKRWMGLTSTQDHWQLAPRLADPPAALPTREDLLVTGQQQRLDLQMAQKEHEAFASALELTRGTRFVNVLDVGVERESNSGEPRMTGPTLALELPIFDQGQARVNKLESLLRQSEDRKTALSTEISTEISSAWLHAETARQGVQHTHDVLMPLRRQIQNQSALYYNGMLIGMNELLADARERINALLGFIDASREYWLAEAELQLAVGGRLPPEAGGISDEDHEAQQLAEPAHQHKEHK